MWILTEDIGKFQIRRKLKQNQIYIETAGPRLNSIKIIPQESKRKRNHSQSAFKQT